MWKNMLIALLHLLWMIHRIFVLHSSASEMDLPIILKLLHAKLGNSWFSLLMFIAAVFTQQQSYSCTCTDWNTPLITYISLGSIPLQVRLWFSRATFQAHTQMFREQKVPEVYKVIWIYWPFQRNKTTNKVCLPFYFLQLIYDSLDSLKLVMLYWWFITYNFEVFEKNYIERNYNLKSLLENSNNRSVDHLFALFSSI